jgi:2-isopropylmalate synthase
MAEQVLIFDTTLRDGEQSPGAAMGVREKLEIAKQLRLLNVDVIEAGFPVSSKEQFEAVRLVAQEVEGPTVAGLARCVRKDVDAAAEALKGAARPRIHVFLATSEIHRKSGRGVRCGGRGGGDDGEHPGHGRLRAAGRVRRGHPLPA